MPSLPGPGTAVRVVAGETTLRCRVAEITATALVLTAPLAVADAAPPATGSHVELWHATPAGMVVYQTQVTGLDDDDPPRVVVRRPSPDETTHMQRRAAVRAGARIPAHVAPAPDPDDDALPAAWSHGLTADLSGGGARIALRDIPPDTDEVVVVLDLASGPVASRATVVRRQAARDGQVVAVRFTGLGPRDEERVVARVFDEHRAELNRFTFR